METMKGCKTVQSLMTSAPPPSSPQSQNNTDNFIHYQESLFKSDNNSESDGYHSDHSETDEQK